MTGYKATGVQTCAQPIPENVIDRSEPAVTGEGLAEIVGPAGVGVGVGVGVGGGGGEAAEMGRGLGGGRGEVSGVGGSFKKKKAGDGEGGTVDGKLAAEVA